MEIVIQENPSSWTSEYDITTPFGDYYAKKKLFSVPAKVVLFSEDRSILAKLNSRFSLRTKYDFLFSDGKTYRFWCEKMWKGVFACEGGEEKYRLYRHKGLNYSIFQDDRQIAALTTNRVIVGKGKQYSIRASNGTNVPVIISMVLALNSAEDDDDRATVTFDFGNIGPEEQPFDRSWKPS